MAAVTSADLSTRLTAMRASTSAMIADFDAQRWADADLRSLNAQIEFLLRRALQESGRLRPKTDAAEEPEDPAAGLEE